MNELNEQIQKLVKDNLPGAQALAFKEYIEESESIKLKGERLKNTIENLDKKVKSQDDTIKEMRKNASNKEYIDQQLEELKKNEEEFHKKELDLENTILVEKLKSANQIVENTMGLVGILFKNKNVDKALFGSVGIDIPYIDQYGNQIMNHQMGTVNGSIKNIEGENE